jgi:hypothetical protein
MQTAETSSESEEESDNEITNVFQRQLSKKKN